MRIYPRKITHRFRKSYIPFVLLGFAGLSTILGCLGYFETKTGRPPVFENADGSKDIRLHHGGYQVAGKSQNRQGDGSQEKTSLVTLHGDERTRVTHTSLTNLLTKKSVTRRYIIYRCNEAGTCGGWADRLKGMIAAYFIAIATNRTFGIKGAVPPCELTSFLLPNKIQWNLSVTSDELAHLDSQYFSGVDSDKFLKDIGKVDLDQLLPKSLVYFKANFEYADAFKLNPHYIEGPWKWIRNLTNAEIYARVIKDLFKLSPALQLELDRFLIRIKPNPQTKLVCSHFRMGKSKTNAKDTIRVLKDEDVNVATEFLRNYLNTSGNDTVLFIMSDSEEIRQAARLIFKDRLVMMNGTFSHIDRPTNKSDICEGLRYLLLEQQVLMRCDVLLISRSGIGRHAAYVRASDDGLFCLWNGKIIPCQTSKLRSFFKVFG